MTRRPRIRDLPAADPGRLDELIAGRAVAVFLDYDGTLTPIVDDPAAATLDPDARTAIERLAAVCPVAIVSGRDLDDVRALVGLDGLHYAGSHGFEIVTPDGQRHERAPETLPQLDAAQAEVRGRLAQLPGVNVERKRFAVAVHFRQADPGVVPEVEQAVDDVAGRHPELRKTGGKKIFELRPAVDWDKGKALTWLLEVLGLEPPSVLPVYVGDDVTDEDAFAALGDTGLGIVVRGEDDERRTSADYTLAGPGEVPALLAGLLEIVRKRGLTPLDG